MQKIIFTLYTTIALFLNSCSLPDLNNDQSETIKTYYTGGLLRSELIVTNKHTQSKILRMYDFEGKLQSSVQMQYGKKDGLETLYDKQGRIIQNTPYVNGLKDGTRVAYYPDGNTMIHINYIKDIREGLAATYNRDGSIHQKIIYKHGLPTG